MMNFNVVKKAKYLMVLFTLVFNQSVYAGDDDYSADGEYRAKSAGKELIGTPAPQMEMTTIDGKTIDLADVYGKKPVYIKFWATWCVPCRQQMPGFEEIYKKYGKDIQVIAINTGISDNIQSVTGFAKQMGLTMPITIDDGSLARAFHLRVTPQHLLIDKNGKYAYFGHVDDEEFHQALETVIKEKSDGKPLNNPTFEPKDSGYHVGDTVKDLSLSDIDNQTMDLKFHTPNSKKIGLVFFGPWCEWYLEKTEPKTSKACTNVRESLEKVAKDSDTTWITISTNLWSSLTDLEDYRKNYKTSLPIIFDQDGSLFKQFGVNQVPTIVLVDSDGKLTVKSSIQDDNFDEVLQKLTAEK